MGLERVAIGHGVVGLRVQAAQPGWQCVKLVLATITNLGEGWQLTDKPAAAEDRNQKRLPFASLVGLRDVVATDPAVMIAKAKHLLGHRIRPFARAQLELAFAGQLDQFVDHG